MIGYIDVTTPIKPADAAASTAEGEADSVDGGGR